MFWIIFVFLPVYITSPYASLVFFSLAPLYSSCLSPERTRWWPLANLSYPLN